MYNFGLKNLHFINDNIISFQSKKNFLLKK